MQKQQHRMGVINSLPNSVSASHFYFASCGCGVLENLGPWAIFRVLALRNILRHSNFQYVVKCVNRQ